MDQVGRRIAIVGAGIFGVATAIELARRGHAVTLVDRGAGPHPRAASTDISKTIRIDYGADVLYTELMENALEGWRRWNREWGRPLFHESGMLFLASHPSREGTFEHDSLALLRARGHYVEPLEPAQLARRFPAWAQAPHVSAYFNPVDGWVESGKVVSRLLTEARAAGVRILHSWSVERLVVTGSGVRGLLGPRKQRVDADEVVLATGSWTSDLMPDLRDALHGIGTPIFHLQPEDPAPFQAPHFPTWAADVDSGGWYGFPADATGLVKVGNHSSTRPLHPDSPRTLNEHDEANLRHFLGDALPSLARAPLAGGRLCLYCQTLDGDFWIDRPPDRTGLVVAGGGSGHAFKFAPVIGGVIADVVDGNETPLTQRFAWRDPDASGSKTSV